ncbi:hypothetical protein POK33_39075 [Burkholderia cenocepacia]|uniref:hypothetical protein n=1 Tax=Burkholderia cenocepacia TaxID=95486 RepID=UPI0023B98F04|nr:hypothetical protein [Burkholderia cenocepacia]MDF0506758.1 hypothetical protein [Burkholderia cenocepacia]
MSRKLLIFLGARGRYTTIHVAASTLLATAAFIIFTAGDLGPMAPLVIAIAFYLVFAAVAAEVALGVTAATRMIARRTLRRSS